MKPGRPSLRIPDQVRAALALAIPLGMIWVLLVQPLGGMLEGIRSELSEKTAERDRLLARINALEATRTVLAQTETDNSLWEPAPAGARTAQLQSRLTEITRAVGLEIRSLSPRPVRDLAYGSAATVSLETEASLDRLVALLTGIETNRPLLLVGRIALRRLARGAAAEGQPRVLVQIDVTAPARPGETAP